MYTKEWYYQFDERKESLSYKGGLLSKQTRNRGKALLGARVCHTCNRPSRPKRETSGHNVRLDGSSCRSHRCWALCAEYRPTNKEVKNMGH